jgi:aspartate racemase
MDLKNDRTIGIVGGMGPQAGNSLLNDIFRYTDATADQQHLSVVMMSFPKHIADRTSFINGTSTVNPAVNIAEIIHKLEGAGASIIGIACNTSHAPVIFDVILAELRRIGSRVKLLNMPLETCHHIKRNCTNVQRIGLMTTNGTYKAGIYKTILQRLGYEVVLPDPKFQNDVIHKMIYDPRFGIKSTPIITSQVHDLINRSFAFFSAQNTDAIILGCTELSLVIREDRVGSMSIIDSTKVLALALIREASVPASSFVTNPLTV